MHSMYGIDQFVVLSPQSSVRLRTDFTSPRIGVSTCHKQDCGLLSPGPSLYHRTGTSNFPLKNKAGARGCSDTGSLPPPGNATRLLGHPSALWGNALSPLVLCGNTRPRGIVTAAKPIHHMQYSSLATKKPKACRSQAWWKLLLTVTSCDSFSEFEST